MEKPKMVCACECAEDWRCGKPMDDMHDPDYRCECGCHVQDEDGEDDWDRYFDALRQWRILYT